MHVALTVEEETAAPPSPDLTLQLGMPSMPDVTELAPRTDMYELWPGAAPAASTSLAPMPPPASDNEDE
jgi:hypothetical protein